MPIITLDHLSLNPFLDVEPDLGVTVHRVGGDFEEFAAQPRRKYGVLILGDVGTAVLRNASENTGELVYRTLIEKGYKPEHLVALDEREGNGKRLPCTNLPLDKAHLSEVFNTMGEQITNEDAFFLYVLSHGHKDSLISTVGQSYFRINGEAISERDLEAMLSRINPSYSLLFFNSCFGGGFAQRLGHGKSIAISTSRPEKVTYAQHSPQSDNGYGWYGSEFTMHFFSAVRGKTLDGAHIESGGESIMGSFKYAATNVDLRHFISLSKNTPHMFYEGINPSELKL